MKIEVKDNSGKSNIRQCEIPVDSVYSGTEEYDNHLKIFIKEETLRIIDEYLSSDLNNELGGVFVGDVCINNAGEDFILIENLIIAKHTNSSLSRLTFTHETWNYINDILEKDFPGKKILGWFHSHPGHTVFLSNFDIFIQENFFNMEYMVAYVFDPTIIERGFFFWKEKKIVKANGFYIYKNQENEFYRELITTDDDPDSNNKNEKEISINSGKQNMKHDSKNILILGLLLITLLLSILTTYNLFDLKQKTLLKEDYNRDISVLKEDNRKLNEKLNGFIFESELLKRNSEVSDNIDSNKALTKYTVKSGDTVDKIAYEFYKSKEAVQLIIQKNNLKNKWDLKIGQVLELPVVNDQ